ncbi:MAG: pseudouridine synthase [candidate division Zixibacteria bacterium]|jgi:pseudouridine synthase|nr:pseudouridine synthase [candidate division Zixibacteria bacterium]
MSQIRINKYLSLCGVTSRRGAVSLIEEGRVTVNNTVADRPGLIIDDETDVVKVDGADVSLVDKKVYVVLHKPRNVMTTLFDPFKRRTVNYYLKKLRERVYPVGRLDFDTTGVLLLTNDGDLAYRLAHPRYRVAKVYQARVKGHFKQEAAIQIDRGIVLDDGKVGKASVSILGFVRNTTRVRLTLTEGRKREVKQLCKKVGHPVEELERVEFAGITTKNLRAGQWRHLTPREVARLKALVGLA